MFTRSVRLQEPEQNLLVFLWWLQDKTESYLPAGSNLDVNCGLAVPQDRHVFFWEVNYGEISRWPDEHLLLPVNHTGEILQGIEDPITLLILQKAYKTYEIMLTGVPESSSKDMKDPPMLTRIDFLQMIPLSKQSTFSVITFSITSALLCEWGDTVLGTAEILTAEVSNYNPV